MPRARKSKRQRAASKGRREAKAAPSAGRREIAGAKVLKRLPPHPEGLTARAIAEWVRLGRMSIRAGVLTEHDLALLELASRTVASVAELEGILAVEGLTIEGGTGPKAHPAGQMLDRARALSHRMLADLGLTPPARERLSIEPADQVSRPGEDYFR